MKKILALILALCVVLSLCACGQTPAPDGGNTPDGGNDTPNTGVGGTAYPNPLQDVRVRQALWYAIDMEAIVEGLWDNTVVTAD